MPGIYNYGKQLVFSNILTTSPAYFIQQSSCNITFKITYYFIYSNNRSVTGIRDTVTKSLQELNLKENESQNLNYTDLFKTRKLAMITVSSFTIWFVTGVCYFGLNQYTSVLGSNIFIVVAIIGCIQVSYWNQSDIKLISL